MKTPFAKSTDNPLNITTKLPASSRPPISKPQADSSISPISPNSPGIRSPGTVYSFENVTHGHRRIVTPDIGGPSTQPFSPSDSLHSHPSSPEAVRPVATQNENMEHLPPLPEQCYPSHAQSSSNPYDNDGFEQQSLKYSGGNGGNSRNFVADHQGSSGRTSKFKEHLGNKPHLENEREMADFAQSMPPDFDGPHRPAGGQATLPGGVHVPPAFPIPPRHADEQATQSEGVVHYFDLNKFKNKKLPSKLSSPKCQWCAIAIAIVLAIVLAFLAFVLSLVAIANTRHDLVSAMQSNLTLTNHTCIDCNLTVHTAVATASSTRELDASTTTDSLDRGTQDVTAWVSEMSRSARSSPSLTGTEKHSTTTSSTMGAKTSAETTTYTHKSTGEMDDLWERGGMPYTIAHVAATGVPAATRPRVVFEARSTGGSGVEESDLASLGTRAVVAPWIFVWFLRLVRWRNGIASIVFAAMAWGATVPNALAQDTLPQAPTTTIPLPNQTASMTTATAAVQSTSISLPNDGYRWHLTSGAETRFRPPGFYSKLSGSWGGMKGFPVQGLAFFFAVAFAVMTLGSVSLGPTWRPYSGVQTGFADFFGAPLGAMGGVVGIGIGTMRVGDGVQRAVEGMKMSGEQIKIGFVGSGGSAGDAERGWAPFVSAAIKKNDDGWAGNPIPARPAQRLTIPLPTSPPTLQQATSLSTKANLSLRDIAPFLPNQHDPNAAPAPSTSPPGQIHIPELSMASSPSPPRYTIPLPFLLLGSLARLVRAAVGGVSAGSTTLPLPLPQTTPQTAALHHLPSSPTAPATATETASTTTTAASLEARKGIRSWIPKLLGKPKLKPDIPNLEIPDKLEPKPDIPKPHLPDKLKPKPDIPKPNLPEVAKPKPKATGVLGGRERSSAAVSRRGTIPWLFVLLGDLVRAVRALTTVTTAAAVETTTKVVLVTSLETVTRTVHLGLAGRDAASSAASPTSAARRSADAPPVRWERALGRGLVGRANAVEDDEDYEEDDPTAKAVEKSPKPMPVERNRTVTPGGSSATATVEGDG